MTTNVYLERDKKFREWELLYVNMFEIGILEILYKFGGNCGILFYLLFLDLRRGLFENSKRGFERFSRGKRENRATVLFAKDTGARLRSRPFLVSLFAGP